MTKDNKVMILHNHHIVLKALGRASLIHFKKRDILIESLLTVF